MYSDDEKKVVALHKAMQYRRAEFLEAAAARHPTLAEHFNGLAEAVRGLTTYSSFEDPKKDKDLRVQASYQLARNAMILNMLAEKGTPAHDELLTFQKMMDEFIQEFPAKHPELVPARESLTQKMKSAK